MPTKLKASGTKMLTSLRKEAAPEESNIVLGFKNY
jgi:hypothetical protein